jgi:hypothetical protein
MQVKRVAKLRIRRMTYEFDLHIQLETTIDLYQQAREEYLKNQLESAEWSPMNQLRADAREIARLIRGRALALANVGSPSDLNQIYETIRVPDDLEELEFQELQEHFEHQLWEFQKYARAKFSNDEAEQLIDQVKEIVFRNLPDSVCTNPRKLVWEQLCIDDAWHVVSTIQQRVSRIQELERLVFEEWGSMPPPEPCQQFLALVGRCYVYDLVPECVVMCRSAMEAAFRDLMRDPVCWNVLKRKPDTSLTLADRIAAAFSTRESPLFGMPELHKAAQEVQNRGNKVVHYDPHATRDAIGTIRSAARVINALAALSRS